MTATRTPCCTHVWFLGLVGQDRELVPAQRSPEVGHGSATICRCWKAAFTPLPRRLSCTPGHRPPFRKSLSFGMLVGKGILAVPPLPCPCPSGRALEGQPPLSRTPRPGETWVGGKASCEGLFVEAVVPLPSAPIRGMQ